MALQVSTGFKTGILGPNSWKDLFDGGAIALYSGPQPLIADDPAPDNATLLGYITLGGLPWASGTPANGLVWMQAGPQILKPDASSWVVSPVANGLATWFRILGRAYDPGTLSFDAPRIDGRVSALAGSEMRLLNPVLEVGNAKALDYFLYTLPPLTGI